MHQIKNCWKLLNPTRPQNFLNPFRPNLIPRPHTRRAVVLGCQGRRLDNKKPIVKDSVVVFEFYYAQTRAKFQIRQMLDGFVT